MNFWREWRPSHDIPKAPLHTVLTAVILKKRAFIPAISFDMHVYIVRWIYHNQQVSQTVQAQ